MAKMIGVLPLDDLLALNALVVELERESFAARPLLAFAGGFGRNPVCVRVCGDGVCVDA